MPEGMDFFGGDLEDMTSQLAILGEELARGVIDIYGVGFMHMGKPIDQYFPGAGQSEVNDDAGGFII